MPIKTVAIDDETAEILREGRWEGAAYFLPPRQLARPIYEKVNKVLVTLGGKWNRSARAHLFTAEAQDAMRAALDEGEVVDVKRSLEQFFTPPKLAEYLVHRAGNVTGKRVLEPSAGDGSLVRALLLAGPPAQIVACEIDAGMVARLTTLAAPPLLDVLAGDFLHLSGPPGGQVDLIVMNPPFSRGQDMRHVLHAFPMLRPGGRLVSIMSPHWTFAGDRESEDFRAWAALRNADWERQPEGSFTAAGTNVSCGILVVPK